MKKNLHKFTDNNKQRERKENKRNLTRFEAQMEPHFSTLSTIIFRYIGVHCTRCVHDISAVFFVSGSSNSKPHIK